MWREGINSSQSHFSAVVMKNCDPLVFGPALALESSPASVALIKATHDAKQANVLSCLFSNFSSSNYHSSVAFPGSTKIAYLAPINRLPRRQYFQAGCDGRVTHLPASPVTPLEVPALAHEARDHAVEVGALIAEIFWEGFACDFLYLRSALHPTQPNRDQGEPCRCKAPGSSLRSDQKWTSVGLNMQGYEGIEGSTS